MSDRVMLSLMLLAAANLGFAQTQYGPAPKVSSQAHAADVCPWLTQGSAAKALGGDVSVTVNVSDSGEGLCRFARRQGFSDSLEIQVSEAALPLCPPESFSLKGIGNEATRCKLTASHGESAERISSRVRELHFTVTFTSHEQKSATKSPDAQDDALEQVAEQVAGNLY